MEKRSSNFVSKSLGNLFKRFHLIIFFIAVVACLAIAIVMMNQILRGENSDDSYVSPISAGSIDETTLNNIQALHSSSEAQTPALPQGRVNPFSE